MPELIGTYDAAIHASALARVSKLLYSCGNATRLEIMFLLAEQGEVGVAKVVAALELSYPQVSQQLRVLKDLSLVECRKDAQQSFYRLSRLVVSHVDTSSLELIMAISHVDSISISVNKQSEAASSSLANRLGL